MYDGYDVLESGETVEYRLEFELGPADDNVGRTGPMDSATRSTNTLSVGLHDYRRETDICANSRTRTSGLLIS